MAQASMRSSLASTEVDMNDSVESFVVIDADGNVNDVPVVLGGDVELSRGISDYSPMRTIRQYTSPARLSLKEHSELLSVPQLRVSISSDSDQVSWFLLKSPLM